MTASPKFDSRVPICYLAPWVDYGGSDKGTIDWFRWIDRDRFAPFLVTTQPSPNRRIAEIYPFADEVWALPTFLAGQHLPAAIFDLIYSRGVKIVHVMNSRIGYDLLPDLACLPDPPAVVIQLHVEEPDKSGYVRYVTTRYGNLVDAFSVSSDHLARAVASYHVNPSKIHVISTGVDADHEFNPSRVKPATLAKNRFDILFPGRLAEQKDPLLMVDVIQKVCAIRPNAHVHIVGDGPLEVEVKNLVAERNLSEYFSFYPPSQDLATWYAACDALLMTSVFEGVPYVVYEAMAMELPVVAPALPGNVELMANTAGILIDPRDDAAAYVRALTSLIDDPSYATSISRAGRQRVLDHFSLRAMGERHGILYDCLLSAQSCVKTAPARSTRHSREQSTADVAPRHKASPPADMRFSRPAYGQPLVSVIVPCFNHGCFLQECTESITSQQYEKLEVIVVDDASTDPATLAVLTELEATDNLRVVYQRQNKGPSAARNRGIAEARGRYILPVDADNILLPNAIAKLVEQIQSAGETVGYIYPNCQFFGTRDDYFEPPSFNLALLLSGNYCDTCSLIDRDVFDAGLRYAEDIELGHEDWDFALTMATHRVRGEAAATRTLLYRKHGFTRSDAVEHAAKPFREEIEERHPELYGPSSSVGRYGRWCDVGFAAKAQHAPSLSLVLTKPIDFADDNGMAFLDCLAAQSCCDLELIVQCPSLPRQESFFPIRRIPPDLCKDEFALTTEALKLVRGKHVLLTEADPTEMFAEPPFVERLHRTFIASPSLEAIAFTDAKETAAFPYQLVGDEICGYAHAIAWETDVLDRLPTLLSTHSGMLVEQLARAMSANGVAMQWRHAAASISTPSAPCEGIVHLSKSQIGASHHQREIEMIREMPAALPSLGWGAVRRWTGTASWTPPETDILTRHREVNGNGRVVRLGRSSPAGFVLERDLGAIRRFSPPGTVRLIHNSDDGRFRVVKRNSLRRNTDDVLGHLEASPLPLFQAVERAVFHDGSETIVAGEADPLRAESTTLEFLGFIEAFPNLPTKPPETRRSSYEAVGLLRCIDGIRRRHVYRVDAIESGDELVCELGALHRWPVVGSIAVRIDAIGNLVVDDQPLTSVHCSALQLLRWCFAPLAWRGFGRPVPRLRASARRIWEAARHAVTPGSRREAVYCLQDDESPIVGYLHGEDRSDRRALFAAIHPVTGDRLFVREPLEATDMGYRLVGIVGYVLDRAPATGTLATRHVSVPWASRFGLEVRH
jgi:glycosyltransferase involved in cell wall biosynthesis